MATIFEIAAALFAVVAAVFWFLSAAYGELPQIALVDDPLFAVRGAAVMNIWGAGLTAASALCAAVSFLL